MATEVSVRVRIPRLQRNLPRAGRRTGRVASIGSMESTTILLAAESPGTASPTTDIASMAGLRLETANMASPPTIAATSRVSVFIITGTRQLLICALITVFRVE